MSSRDTFERYLEPALRVAAGSIGGRSVVSLCWCITLATALAVPTYAQEVTTKAPTAAEGPRIATDLPQAPSADLYPGSYPLAVPVPEANERKVLIDSDNETHKGDVTVLDGNVSITYGAYHVTADRMEYNEATGDVDATGHLHISNSGPDTETIDATRGSLNIHTQTGRFYDVHGSIGVKATPHGNVYTNGNPFLFSGRVVIRNGPAQFDIIDGSVTSCQLPTPDWELTAARFTVEDGKAKAKNTLFRLRRIPIFFLPYATHPTEVGGRQTGFLIPIIGNSSSKGIVTGEQIYFTLGRSAEMTVGAEYFSRRGWQQSATFHFRGQGLDFVSARYSGLLDRGYYQATTVTNPNGTTTTGSVYTNQGGEDAAFAGRKDFSAYTRAAADVEYLSSYIYREAFTDTFNQAVSSDITSYAYGTHERNGYVASAEFDRYQGLKIVSTGEQIRIFHAPLLQAESMERRVGTTPLLWSATMQYAGLKRTQGTPTAQTGFATGISSRLDMHPQLALPFSFGGFHFRPQVGLRDTLYTQSRVTSPLPGPPPTLREANLNRLVTEAEMEVRMPVLERTFETGVLSRFLGREAKHTIEPELHYRYASGVDDFARTLRFDETDVVSDKNELEYGFTQRLFLRPTKKRDCETGETPNEKDGTCGGARESLRWKLLQRHYFDDTFGGVVVNNRRNVLDTTLDFSGVAFLTNRRSESPILSQMKLSATDHIDVEWDINYDTHAGKFTQSNTFLDFHAGNYFGGLSHARLNAPGRFATAGTGTTTTSLTSDFSQLRVLLGYGKPTKQGLSIAANAGIDLKLSQVQYGTAQFSYNWNCCGFSVEYRKYELGSVRNENAYRFNFTLANIGTAGNLRRAERLF